MIKINTKGVDMNELAGAWLTITEYSRYKDVSISTIRRHIKNHILKYKEENGKYLIYVPSAEKIKIREEEEILKIKLEAELLRGQLRQLREENNELKMLVELYEGQQIKSVSFEHPPEVPLER